MGGGGRDGDGSLKMEAVSPRRGFVWQPGKGVLFPVGSIAVPRSTVARTAWAAVPWTLRGSAGPAPLPLVKGTVCCRPALRENAFPTSPSPPFSPHPCFFFSTVCLPCAGVPYLGPW